MRFVSSVACSVGFVTLSAFAAGCTNDSGSSSEPCTPGVTCTATTDAAVGSASDAGSLALPGTLPGSSYDAGSTFDAGSAAAVDDLPCDVKAVLNTHCGTCHSAGGSAPEAFASTADFRGNAKTDATATLVAAAKDRLTSTVNTRMMPPAGYPRLSADELTTMQTWLNAGTPARSGAACSNVPVVNPPTTNTPPAGATCFKILAHDASSKTVKYKVGAAKDSYVNMTFNAPWGTDTRYAVSLKPVIDNTKAIHHWLLFQEGGVDGAVVPGTGAHPGGTLVTGWAPGGEGVDLTGNPDDVGYEMPGSQYTIEFHYNSDDASAQDASGVEICMTDHKPKNIASISWLGYDNTGLPSMQWTGTCKPSSSQPIHIVAVTPHMHKTGNRMRGVINRKDGSKETLHDAPFDFNYQQTYKKDFILNPGDTVTTDCWYNAFQSFGESTSAEMCYLFTYAYPKGALADLGAWGAVAHGGSSCLGQ